MRNNIGKAEVRVVALLSGGLDSTLAIRVLQEQGIIIEAVHFATIFSHRPRSSNRESPAKRMADQLGVKLHTIDISAEQLEMVKSPRYGHGSSMNPCIDCHIFMARKAKELMETVGAICVATGEVLGQRPMSQHKQALQLVEKQSGLQGLLLRPLSAQLLPPTLPEQQGLIDRSKLLAIRGRSRKTQMELAARFGITDYPTPAGGCLLTDKIFGRRLQELLDHDPDASLDEINLLRCGRHLRLDDGTKVIVARAEEECNWLEAHRGTMATFVATDYPGPLVLASPNVRLETARLVAAIAASYGKGKDKNSVKVLSTERDTETVLEVEPIGVDAVSRWMIF